MIRGATRSAQSLSGMRSKTGLLSAVIVLCAIALFWMRRTQTQVDLPWLATPETSASMQHFLTQGCIDRHHVDIETLMLIPGIGHALSAKIVTYVDSKLRSSQSPLEFHHIRGIGKANASQLKAILCPQKKAITRQTNLNRQQGF